MQRRGTSAVRLHSMSALPPHEPVEPLAARMLNEVVYCPRLFYYEHVEGVFVHNADTRRGAALHKRLDAGKGALPAPGKVEGPTPTKTEEPADHRVAASRPASKSTWPWVLSR
jgi:hypothetical protein